MRFDLGFWKGERFWDKREIDFPVRRFVVNVCLVENNFFFKVNFEEVNFSKINYFLIFISVIKNKLKNIFLVFGYIMENEMENNLLIFYFF